MPLTPSPPTRRGTVVALIAAAALCALAGCQSYEPAPLELERHPARIAARLDNPEPIAAFARRLAGGDEPPVRFDPADGLTPAEGEVLAIFYNPDLRLARLDAGIALATYDTAGLWQDPQFGFDAAEILSPAGAFEYGVMLNLTIPVSGRLEVERDRAGAAYEAELRRVVDAEWSLRAEVRSAWAAWAASSERVRLLREVIEQVGRISSITDDLESAGELTRTESRLIRVEAMALRTDLVAAERAQMQARLRLLGLMGLPADATIELIPDFPTVPIPAAADATQRLIEANTTLAVHRAEYQVAEETLRLEMRRQYPDVTVGAGYGNENDDRLLLGVSLPIPVLNANRAGIAEARARRERARAAAETAFERLERELASAGVALDAARRQRETVETLLVPELDLQASEVEQLAALGEVNTLLLLETVKRGFDARSRLLDLRTEEVTAAGEIARLLGPDQPPRPSLNTPDSNTPDSTRPDSTTLESTRPTSAPSAQENDR